MVLFFFFAGLTCSEGKGLAPDKTTVHHFRTALSKTYAQSTLLLLTVYGDRFVVRMDQTHFYTFKFSRFGQNLDQRCFTCFAENKELMAQSQFEPML